MKQLAVFFLFGLMAMLPKAIAQKKLPVYEWHGSVNHLINTDPEAYTFFGGGFGANVVFWNTRLFSLKTGIETNFFHTWDQQMINYKETYKTNAHYNYWDLSIPLMFRLNMGKKGKIFMEAGGYVGIPLKGSVTSTNIYLNPPGTSGISSVAIQREEYKSYLSLSAAVSVGCAFPVSKGIDVIVKPEFVFRAGLNTPEEVLYKKDVNEQFFYTRLCVGIRMNLNREIE